MKTRHMRITSLLATLLLPTVGWPAEATVQYLVDLVALKKGLVASTPLTFQLYTDPDCTVASGPPIAINAGDLDLVEKVKTFRLREGIRKPPLLRLQHRLTGIPLDTAIFLAITGDGILPAQGSCQFQFQSVSGAGTLIPCVTASATDVFFNNCNVHIRNGTGTTDGVPNGRGNLIVGYNENDGGDTKNGSHNLVIGPHHTYTSFGGIVAGLNNRIAAAYASVTGGDSNAATGITASVSGGTFNTASGTAASATGGTNNIAIGDMASVTGGQSNTASAASAAVTGGTSNVASGLKSSVTGGESNDATGENASVSGGANNTAGGIRSSVSGGGNRSAAGLEDWAAGGLFQDL